MKQFLPLLLLPAVVLSAAESPAGFKVTKDNIFGLRNSLKRLTKTPYSVSPAIEAACGPGGGVMIDKKSEPAPTRKPYPHAYPSMLVYANALADETLSKKGKVFPVGAMIVKEKLDRKGGVTGVGGMIKRAAGFDAKNGDWEYFYADERGSLLSKARLESCVNCHTQAREKDFVFADWMASAQ
jgi:hypothetical protein